MLDNYDVAAATKLISKPQLLVVQGEVPEQCACDDVLQGQQLADHLASSYV